MLWQARLFLLVAAAVQAADASNGDVRFERLNLITTMQVYNDSTCSNLVKDMVISAEQSGVCFERQQPGFPGYYNTSGRYQKTTCSSSQVTIGDYNTSACTTVECSDWVPSAACSVYGPATVANRACSPTPAALAQGASTYSKFECATTTASLVQTRTYLSEAACAAGTPYSQDKTFGALVAGQCMMFNAKVENSNTYYLNSLKMVVTTVNGQPWLALTQWAKANAGANVGNVVIDNGATGCEQGNASAVIHRQNHSGVCFTTPGPQGVPTWAKMTLLGPAPAPTPAPATPAPTSAPTPAPTAAATIISQTMKFGDLSAAQYVGDTKTTYEVGYGISIGVYNSSANPPGYLLGATVNSSVARRSISVTFSAKIPAGNGAVVTLAQAASTKASTITPTSFSANVATAATALSLSVAAPNASSITATSPDVSGGASGSDSSDDDDGNGAVIGGSIGGAVAFIIIVALLYMFCKENTGTGKMDQGEI